MAVEPTIICITPVRDEAWILPLFLEVNSKWADVIIILDQCSIDRTAEIAKAHPKVIYIKNESADYDELSRQKLLYNAARKIKASKRIIIALDADEYLQPTGDQDEWRTIKLLEKGTVIKFDWLQVIPKSTKWWKVSTPIAFGFIDDGVQVEGGKIHNSRVPNSQCDKEFICKSLVNIHLQYLPTIRNRKKSRWYQVWELVNNNLHPVDIYRNYNKRLNVFPKNELISFNEKWLSPLSNHPLNDIADDAYTWWDKDIIDLFDKYGVSFFKKLDIWDVDWNKFSSFDQPVNVKNPGSVSDKIIVGYLKLTQKWKRTLLIGASDKLIKLIW